MSTERTPRFRDDNRSGLVAMMPGNGAGDGQPSQNEWMRW